jgi:hypothetical protein
VNEFANRAFAAFTIALGASLWALFTDIGRPFLPSIPIVVYAVYLFANRAAVGQLGGDALRDSPYFLGFLLTMLALFKIFNDVSFNASLFGQNPALMTQEVGGAVLTTIIGLFCRQALISLVPDVEPEEEDRIAALANAVTSHAVAFEVARQQFFREMSDERARQAEEFRAAQSQLLDRIATLPTAQTMTATTAAANAVAPTPVVAASAAPAAASTMSPATSAVSAPAPQAIVATPTPPFTPTVAGFAARPTSSNTGDVIPEVLRMLVDDPTNNIESSLARQRPTPRAPGGAIPPGMPDTTG